MYSSSSSIVVVNVILLDFPDDFIPTCIANFKSNFAQREHKQQKKSWKRFDHRFVLREQNALAIAVLTVAPTERASFVYSDV